MRADDNRQIWQKKKKHSFKIRHFWSNWFFFPYWSYDYLKITNERSEIFGVICGSRYGTDIIVTGAFARLIFHSDSEFGDRGFNISFTVVPKPGECNQESAFFFTKDSWFDRLDISLSQTNVERNVKLCCDCDIGTRVLVKHVLRVSIEF